MPKPAHLEKLAQAMVDSKKYKRSPLHGHHIVMKESKIAEAIEAQRLMNKYDVGLMDKKEDFRKAVREAKEQRDLNIISEDEMRDQFANVCYAINHVDEIHQEKYAKAVLDKIQEGVDRGLERVNKKMSKEEIDKIVGGEIKIELAKMRVLLEQGDAFWLK